MNQYCPVHTTKFKRPLLFKLEMRMKSLELHISKPTNLLFEFTYGKSVICSKNFHRVDSQAFRATINETIEMPILIAYDPRKDRFSSQNVQINILFQNPKFSKKIATTSLAVSQILNSKVLLSREKLKLDKCSDKNAYLNLTAELEFRGSASEDDSVDKSYFSVSGSR